MLAACGAAPAGRPDAQAAPAAVVRDDFRNSRRPRRCLLMPPSVSSPSAPAAAGGFMVRAPSRRDHRAGSGRLARPRIPPRLPRGRPSRRSSRTRSRSTATRWWTTTTGCATRARRRSSRYLQAELAYAEAFMKPTAGAAAEALRRDARRASSRPTPTCPLPRARLLLLLAHRGGQAVPDLRAPEGLAWTRRRRSSST